MSRVFYKKNKFNKAQQGFTLVVVLFIIGILGSVLTGMSLIKSNETFLNEAKIAGWEGAQISRAARIYVRDLNEANPSLKNFLATNPSEILISDLIDLNLLPPNFARTDGTDYFNSLNQIINIYMANYPIDGDPSDPKTTAAAYVVFKDNSATTANLMFDVANSLFSNDVPIQAPTFDETTNISGSCGLSDAVSIWDSGCISAAQYQILTTEVFTPGSLIVPAWQSANFDTRAVLRYPSVQDSGFQTMLTDLKMASEKDCVANPADFITIPSDSGVSQQTNFCGATDDDIATLTDNRRSIENINNISGGFYLTDRPSTNTSVYRDYQAGVGTIKASNPAIINGGLTMTGSAKSYGDSMNIGNNLDVDRNITLSSETGGVAPSVNVNNIDTGNIFTDDLTVTQRPVVASDFSISNNVTNVSSVDANNELVANDLVGNGASPINISVSNALNVSNTATSQQLIINGTNNVDGYTMLSGQISAQNLNINNDAIIANTAYLRASANSGIINITNPSLTAQCFGECPLREADENCQNLASTGTISYTDCMAEYR